MNMNGKSDSRLSRTSEKIAERSITSVVNTPQDIIDFAEGQTSTRPTYEIFIYLLRYFIMFIFRLGRDLFQSVLLYFYSENVLPNHIVDLMNAQKIIQFEHDLPRLTADKYNVIKYGNQSSTSTDNLPKHFNTLQKKPSISDLSYTSISEKIT